MLQPTRASARPASPARRRTISPPPSSTACRVRRRRLPCRFFYDARGSELFEEITRLPEYYPTRTETAILEAHAAEMAEGGAGRRRARGVRLGLQPQDGDPAAAAAAARRLRLHRCFGERACRGAARRLASRFPTLDVRPIVGDFSRAVTLPGRSCRSGPRPASSPARPSATSRRPRPRACSACSAPCLAPSGRLIVGVDLKKDARQLVLAYNDARRRHGRVQPQPAGPHQPRARRHVRPRASARGGLQPARGPHRDAPGEPAASRRCACCGRRFHFRAGERIHTENSYKYSIGQFQELARAAGWKAAPRVDRPWRACSACTSWRSSGPYGLGSRWWRWWPYPLGISCRMRRAGRAPSRGARARPRRSDQPLSRRRDHTPAGIVCSARNMRPLRRSAKAVVRCTTRWRCRSTVMTW